MNITSEKEKSLIGMLLQRPGAFAETARLLQLADFTDPQAQRTFAALLLLEERGLSPNIQGLLAVSRESGNPDQQSADLAYWLEAQRTTASTVNLEAVAASLAEDGRCRRIRAALQDICVRSEQEPLTSAQMLAEADAQLLALGEGRSDKEPVLLSQPMEENIRLIRQHISEGASITGLSTGFPRLDEATLGLQPTDLIILAARPACGKTTMALSLLLNMARQGTPVALFSIEMGARQIAMKALSNIYRIGGYKLRKGYLTPEELDRLSGDNGPRSNVESQKPQGSSQKSTDNSLPSTASSFPPHSGGGCPEDGRGAFYLIDSPSTTLADIRRQARRLVKQHGVRCICIDYLQLISGAERTGRYYNRELEVAQISHGLKALAKELDIAVIALAQMNRAVEQRRQDGGRPQLSDLRESGSIEQDADLVCFLHKRELPAEMEVAEASGAIAPITTLVIAKHRNGLCTDIDFTFRGEYSLFEETEK